MFAVLLQNNIRKFHQAIIPPSQIGKVRGMGHLPFYFAAGVVFGLAYQGRSLRNRIFAQESFNKELRDLIRTVEDVYPVFKFQEGDDLHFHEAYQKVRARQEKVMITGTEKEKQACATHDWFQDAFFEALAEKDFSQLDQQSREIFQTITGVLNTNTVPVIGYGSLMNHDSATLTFSPLSVQSSDKVIVYGHHRIFNTNWPFILNPLLYGSKTETAFLNIQRLENPESYMSAVLFRISEQEFVAFRVREMGYDLVPVVAESRSGNKREIAYALRASHPSYLTGPRQNPVPWYAAMVGGPLAATQSLISPSTGCAAIHGSSVDVRNGSDWSLYLDSTRLANGQRLVELQKEPDFLRLVLGMNQNYQFCDLDDIR